MKSFKQLEASLKKKGFKYEIKVEWQRVLFEIVKD